MPRVYVHIGLHKTGTTAVQHGLIRNRAALMESGFHYPMTLGPSLIPEQNIFGHHMVAWSLYRRKHYLPAFAQIRDRDEVRDILRLEIARAENTILSSEAFDCLTLEEIQDLKSMLGCEIVPVIFLRQFAELMESAYRTTVMHSQHIGTADEFVTRQRTRLDYLQLAKDWLSVSNGQVILLDYDDPDVRSDALGAFLAAIGTDIETAPQETSLNRSFPAHVCELVRLMKANGCSQADALKWARQMPNAVLPNSWCLTASVIEAQDNLYMREIDLLERDPEIGSFLGKPLTRVEERGPVSSVGNPVAALFALAQAPSPGTSGRTCINAEMTEPGIRFASTLRSS